MTGPDGGRERRSWLDTWAPRIALVTLPVLWIVLTLTLPQRTDRGLTIDVACTSGNPAVAAWIESQSGGSGFAQAGEPGNTQARRYTFQQTFSGRYQVHVGCGGTPQHWGIVVWSTFSDLPYRRLVCDDVTDVGTGTGMNGCRDQSAG